MLAKTSGKQSGIDLHRFGVAIVDLELPDHKGFEVVREIQARGFEPKSSSFLAILALVTRRKASISA